MRNKHGLGRDIPAKVAREVRRRSKFGCVRCRRGIYQFEHIDPPFESATNHDPDRICCLCAGCHDLVTRGHLSKVAIQKMYLEIQRATSSEVQPPTGPLDFHDGNAELLIGGITYRQAPEAIVRLHGIDVMIARPGTGKYPADISAIFTDESGNETLRLVRNEWQGALDAWDIEIEGAGLAVRSKATGRIALELDILAPGRLIINRLDMRIHDCHLLISQKTHAIGRYTSESDAQWLHAGVGMINTASSGIAIDFASPAILRARFDRQKHSGKFMADAHEEIVIGNRCGAMIIPAGLAIGTLCGTVQLTELATGNRPVAKVRDIVFNAPDKLSQYLGTGSPD